MASWYSNYRAAMLRTHGYDLRIVSSEKSTNMRIVLNQHGSVLAELPEELAEILVAAIRYGSRAVATIDNVLERSCEEPCSYPYPCARCEASSGCDLEDLDLRELKK